MTNFKVNLNEYIEGELDTVHDISDHSFWMGNEIWWSGGETAGVSRALLTASFVWKVVLKFSSVEMWTEGKTCSFYSTIVLRPNKSFIRNRSGGTSMEINGNLTCTCGWIVRSDRQYDSGIYFRECISLFDNRGKKRLVVDKRRWG